MKKTSKQTSRPKAKKKELTIFLGTDHGGFALKEAAKKWLLDAGYLISDLGAKSLKPNDDYTTYGIAVAEAVASDPEIHRGIVFCRSGEGMAIIANRFATVRASLVLTPKQARETREDNDSNVLSLAADHLTSEQAHKIIDVWLTTPFSKKPRHIRRIRVLGQFGTGVYCC